MDLLIELNQRIYPIEYKYKEHPDSSDLKGIRKLREMYGELVAQSVVASLTHSPYVIADDVVARPGWRAWDLD